jgi:hypothetical protein
MRSLLALTALIALTSPSPARACGWDPEPHLLAVSSHYVGRGGHRAFVVLDEGAPDDIGWKLLAPGTYDGTKIANAPAFDAPIEVTVVGPSGRRVIRSERRVYLWQPWRGDGKPHAAIEIPLERGDDFTVALAGAYSADELAWHAIQMRDGADVRDATAWLASRKLTPGRNVAVGAVAGTDLEIVTFEPSVYDIGHFIVRRGDAAATRQHRGYPRGVLDVYDSRFAVLDDGSTVRVF